MTELSAVVQSFYDHWAAGEVSESRPMFTDDAVIVTPAGTFGIDAHEQMGHAFMAAFPDSHMDISRMVSVGDEVWVTGSFRGTQTGDLVGEQGTIPASGKDIDLPFAEVFTIRDGRIARQETYWDQMTMMAQIGALPTG
ncbi:MAG TPA: ester cyclase [Solirubrobacteraceae bacterium]|nr:ester cyclase [Solirubrobacteraceae bacterium]